MSESSIPRVEWLIAAPHSGGGKTIVTTALLTVLRRRGLAPAAFKCGPDYLDPTFHRAALGAKGCNLDLFLSSPQTVQQLYARYTEGHRAAIVEGVMGFYDGLGGTTDRASSWDVASVLDLPVLLVLHPKGTSLTLAAEVKGLLQFRPDSHIRAILLNNTSPRLAAFLASMIEKETGLPVLGCLPPLETAQIQSRHLGLYRAEEIEGLQTTLSALADAWEENVDMERLLSLGRKKQHSPSLPTLLPSPLSPRPRIAVAQDEAFCFVYAETLDSLQEAGAELVFFSPLHDTALPDGVSGLYLPGGYPERYASHLSQNQIMRQSIQKAIQMGLPTVAECGGFLYLEQELADEEGEVFSMVGALEGRAERKKRLVRFGYAELTATGDSLLFRAGETVPIHEFHYWDSTQNGNAFEMKKPLTGQSWRCGWASPTLYAAFPHLYFAGYPQLSHRFIQAAREFVAKHPVP